MAQHRSACCGYQTEPRASPRDEGGQGRDVRRKLSDRDRRPGRARCGAIDQTLGARILPLLPGAPVETPPPHLRCTFAGTATGSFVLLMSSTELASCKRGSHASTVEADLPGAQYSPEHREESAPTALARLRLRVS